MARYRKIRTDVRSERDLARALAEMGFEHVEVHADARPLDDWIGRPTDVLANVIVRRKDLGASSDDLGFVRNADGTFDLVLSDIHLFKFDRKWIEEVARRTGTASVAAGPVQYAAENISHANPAHAKSAPRPPPAPVEQNLEQRARIETIDLLERAKKSLSLGAWGCLIYFLPVLPWLLLQQIPATATGVGGLVVLMIVWSMIFFIGVAMIVTTRLRGVARDFQRRFPTREARGAAIAQLKSVANDKQNKAADAAKKFLAEVERLGTRPVMPPPPTSSRGPDGKAH